MSTKKLFDIICIRVLEMDIFTFAPLASQLDDVGFNLLTPGFNLTQWDRFVVVDKTNFKED